MKIGILTFHSQLNYGGVLQCWALKTALEQLGHDVIVVDRWHDADNWLLRREFASLTSRGWAKLLVRGLFGCGDLGKLLRTIRTIRFVRALGLSKEHFCQWEDLGPSDSNLAALDLLVVGSDQVWHCGDWGDPRPYLLEGAPPFRAISYAASFGMANVPVDKFDLYKRGLERFSAISCREQEGVNICRDLGYAAAHVVDPTLLLAPDLWCRLTYVKKHSRPAKLVCYFMSVDLPTALPLLEKFAVKMKCSVEVLTNNQPMLKPLPRSVSAFVWNFRRSRVRICRGYGPKEFVRAFAEATWTLTDSFHAVMFSSFFNCNARFIRPSTAMRRAMFARVEEFADKCIMGLFFVDDVEQALLSFEHGETISYNHESIDEMRAESMKWLAEAIKS